MPRPASIIARLNSILNTPGFGFHTPAPQDAAGSPQDALPYTRFPTRPGAHKAAPAPASDAPEADPLPVFRSRRAPRVQPRRAALPEGYTLPERPPAAIQKDTFRFKEDLPEGLMSLDVSDVEAALRRYARIPDDWAVSTDFRRGYELAAKNIALGIYHRLVDKRQAGG